MATLIALISRQHGMHHHAFLFSSQCEYGLWIREALLCLLSRLLSFQGLLYFFYILYNSILFVLGIFMFLFKSIGNFWSQCK